jgi:hypothetical protein
MLFIEIPIFTKHLSKYLDDDTYKKLQNFLIEQPAAGDIVQGTGGLRKLRWSLNGKGKQGGIRIIYYWHVSEDQIYFLTLYAKNEISDLSSDEKKALKKMMEDLL